MEAKYYKEIINNIEYDIAEKIDTYSIRKEYYLNNKLHNQSGPALISHYKNYNLWYKAYYINGKLHNKNSAAVIQYYKNGIFKNKFYYINGNLLKNINTDEELKNYLKYKNF